MAAGHGEGPAACRRRPPDNLAPFSVVELDGGTLVGAANLWGIDTHNRNAHVGVGLLPAARGKGYGTDVVATLCYYGFVVRGLQRLQIETLADNEGMIRAAERNGFVREGCCARRRGCWGVHGRGGVGAGGGGVGGGGVG